VVDPRAKSRVWGPRALPRSIAPKGPRESRPVGGGHALRLRSAPWPASPRRAGGRSARPGGELVLAPAHLLERVGRGLAPLAAARGQAGAQRERAALLLGQRRPREGVVLVLDDELPAQHRELARRRDDRDLHPAPALHAVVSSSCPPTRWRPGVRRVMQCVDACRCVTGGLATRCTHRRGVPGPSPDPQHRNTAPRSHRNARGGVAAPRSQSSPARPEAPRCAHGLRARGVTQCAVPCGCVTVLRPAPSTP
jgi:hypothetical protein